MNKKDLSKNETEEEGFIPGREDIESNRSHDEVALPPPPREDRATNEDLMKEKIAAHGFQVSISVHQGSDESLQDSASQGTGAPPEVPQPVVQAPPIERTNQAMEDPSPSNDEENGRQSLDTEIDVQTTSPTSGEVHEQATVEDVETEASTSSPPSYDNATVSVEVVQSAVLVLTPEQRRRQLLDDAVSATNVRPVLARSSHNKGRAWLVVLALVVVSAVAISLGVTLSKRGRDDTALSVSPTPAPTSVRFGQVVTLVEAISTTTSLQDPVSSQYQAAQWMANEDAQFVDLSTVDPDHFLQRYILVLLYFATGGPASWIETSFFLKPDVHECEWVETVTPVTHYSGFLGVSKCSNEMFVEEIEIKQNNLTGTLPQELGSLPFLTGLLFYENQIGGTLSPSLFSLTDLQILYLWSNDLTGTIPTEIGRTTSMQYLDLESNSITGTIPTEIGRLSVLEIISLRLNFFTGTVPETLARLSNLFVLDVANNFLSSTLPSTLWLGFSNLLHIYVWTNSLSGTIPNNLHLLPHLERFILGKNNFTGPFPSSIVKLTNVTHFNVAENTFTGSLSNDWTNLSSTLEHLQVAQNQLTGTLPESLGGLTKLEWLNLHYNEFSGEIPGSLGNLTKLQSLLLGGSRLTGTVSTGLARLSSLHRLTLERTELTGDLSFLCNGTEMLFPYMTHFFADCLGENREVVCPCCNLCCDANDKCLDV